jgi:hypothetical protein
MFLSLADINKVEGAKNGSKKEIEEAAKPTRGKWGKGEHLWRLLNGKWRRRTL